MTARYFLLILLSFNYSLSFSQSQVRIRLFTTGNPAYVFFKAVSGSYTIDCYNGSPLRINEGEILLISRYRNKISLKPGRSNAFLADSALITAKDDNCFFSLRTGSGNQTERKYRGTLECHPDFDALFLVNSLNTEDYIAGVVKAEGGSGKNDEYFKSQAIIARTYTYRYFHKHGSDRYNLCDDTHCQAFNGITTDSLILRSVKATEGKVLVSSDSTLIISAFHSNCGGETSPSEMAWLSPHPYLVKVTDPYCVTSKNASWKKVISLKEWKDMLERNGYKTDSTATDDSFSFIQKTRVADYSAGSFRIPFVRIRSELGLRSSWFSVSADGDSVILTGKGYGHGVGLCQEGAMVMALNGKKSDEILKFYYSGTSIVSIDDAKTVQDDKKPSN